MNQSYTSLPKEIGQSIKDGDVLFGDDFNNDQLTLWFKQEQEAFYEGDAGNSDVDPWYSYMRYVNERLGFQAIDRAINEMLVLGPGSGVEVEKIAISSPDCKMNFLEASDNFQVILQSKFRHSVIIKPEYTGEIGLADNTQDLVCAYSVLHHIPNISKVLNEASRVTKVGGYLFIREPCSSMGDWRYPRSATPNERGISRKVMVEIATHAGFELDMPPVSALFEPINTLLKRTIGFKLIPHFLLYMVDRSVSWIVSWNDYYWRDTWFKKIGPSAYYYRFKKVQ